MSEPTILDSWAEQDYTGTVDKRVVAVVTDEDGCYDPGTIHVAEERRVNGEWVEEFPEMGINAYLPPEAAAALLRFLAGDPLVVRSCAGCPWRRPGALHKLAADGYQDACVHPAAAPCTAADFGNCPATGPVLVTWERGKETL